MKSIVEMNHINGTVEYSYDANRLRELEPVLREFHSLNELLTLVDQTKLREIEKELHVHGIMVEAICLNTQTTSSETKAEMLLMREECYGQVIQTT